MTIPRRLASVAALAAVLAAMGALGSAAPVSAFDLHTIAAVGSIDSIAVEYSGTDDRPELHILGWAGDLNQGNANGDSGSTASIELYRQGPGGVRTTVAWAENTQFDYPRPDVPQVYPALGPNQGFEVHALAPATGVLNVCIRFHNLNAVPESASPVACRTVTVPAKRPAFRAVMSGPGTVGSPLVLSLSGASGGTDSYSWWRENLRGVRSVNPSPIAGATARTFAAGPDLIGHAVFGVITTRIPGLVIEQSDYVQIRPPFTGPPEYVASDDRYSTSIAASQKAFPDATTGVPVAYIASGAAFADALSAGPAAAKLHGTLLLTPPGGLDFRVATELVRLHPARIVVVGGPAALSERVVSDLKALPFTPIVQRISGADRFVVSRAVVADAFGASIPDVYLVTGTAFPDALAAATAGASTGRPVLLTDGRLGAPDTATIAALHDWATTHVTIVGGTASVSTGIGLGLGAGISVTRSAGQDRFATAAALARTLTPSGTAYLANGLEFPDALTAAVMAGAHPAPLLLTAGDCTPTPAQSALIDTGVSHLVLVGGNAVQAGDVADYAC